MIRYAAASIVLLAALFSPAGYSSAADSLGRPPSRPPVVSIGAGLAAADTPPASLLRPTTLRVTFRVPPADDALYVITPSYVRDLTVTITGPGPHRRRTIAATTALPGRILGLRLPADASAADAVDLQATTVSTATPPFLVSSSQLGALAWSSWSYTVLFGIFCALALLAAALALRMRSWAFAAYAALAAARAALTIPWIGIVRPDPVVSQLLHAAEESAVFALLAAFVFAYRRRAAGARAGRGAPRRRALAVTTWLLVALSAATVAGGDVMQDVWPLNDAFAELPEAALALTVTTLAYGAMRARIAGAGFVVAGAAVAAVTVIVPDVAFQLRTTSETLQTLPLLGDAVQAVLFAIGLTVRSARAGAAVSANSAAVASAALDAGENAAAVRARAYAAIAGAPANVTPPVTTAATAMTAGIAETANAMPGRIAYGISPPRPAPDAAASPAAILAALAEIDGLTGIANRTALDTALATAWERARRAGTPLAVLIADVDLLKKYNALYGPEAGDDVLRRVAAALAETTERTRTTTARRRRTDTAPSLSASPAQSAAASQPAPDDLVGRYGAEEFLVILADADAAEGRRVADAALTAVSALDIAHRDAPAHRVTISIGIAAFVPEAAGNGYELIRRANTALYLAKTLGRNRVVVDEPSAPAP